MSYRRLAGVQSTPRVMRGAPVRHGFMFDVPLMERSLGDASSFVGRMSKTTMLLAGIGAVGLIYYLRGKRK